MARNAENFFYEYAGYGYDPKTETKEQGRRRGAKRLAEAEQWAAGNGYDFQWRDEIGPWEVFLEGAAVDPDDVSAILSVFMTDSHGNVVQSLGGVMEGYDSQQNRNYRRVVEAELALDEMLTQEPLLHRANPRRGVNKKSRGKSRSGNLRSSKGRNSNPGSIDRYDKHDLGQMDTISSGHFADLKMEQLVSGVPTRWWLSRMTVEDGEEHAVYVEQLRGGVWEDVHAYGRPDSYSGRFGNPSGTSLSRKLRVRMKGGRMAKRKSRKSQSVYVATQYIYDGGGDMGTHQGVIVKAPTEEIGVEYTEDMMRGGEAPVWPEYRGNVQWDPGSIEFAHDVGEYGFYYTIIEDTDISQPAYDEAIASGVSEEEAAELAYEEGRVTVGIQPLTQRTFASRQAALDWLESDGLYTPHRVKEAAYPWEENGGKRKTNRGAKLGRGRSNNPRSSTRLAKRLRIR